MVAITFVQHGGFVSCSLVNGSLSPFSQDYLGSSPCQLTYRSALAPSGASPPTSNTWHNIPSNAPIMHHRSAFYSSLIIPCLAPSNAHGRHSTGAPDAQTRTSPWPPRCGQDRRVRSRIARKEVGVRGSSDQPRCCWKRLLSWQE